MHRPDPGEMPVIMLPARSPNAVRAMWWIRIVQMIILSVPVGIIGFLLAVFGWEKGASVLVAIGAPLALWMLFLLVDLVLFVRHARRPQRVAVHGGAVHWYSRGNRGRQADLADIVEVLVSPREFGLFGCADLYLRNESSQELDRVLVMYDQAVVADVAAFIEAHRKTAP